MKNDESRTIRILCLFGLIPVIWLALLIAPAVSGGLPEILQHFPKAMETPFHVELCQDSKKTVLIFMLIYGLGMSPKVKRGFRRYCATVGALCLCALLLPVSASATATTGDPLTVVNNLSTFIFGMIRAVGMILLGWGIVQVGLSLQSHDPSQRSNGFLTLAGGIIITFAKEILTMITG